MSDIEYEYISPVKRARRRKLENLKRRNQMRNDLPILTKDEVRRFRIPYDVAICSELIEQGFPSTAEYIKQLIDYQEAIRDSRGPDSAIWLKPRLIESKEQINRLCEMLRSAEGAHIVGNNALECDSLIKLGVGYLFGSSDWSWIGEQVMAQAISTACDYHDDGHRREAISKYVYGKYLLKTAKNVKQAKEYLDRARNLAVDKSWTAAGELGIKQDSLFSEVCMLLFEIHMAEARARKIDDPLFAINICVEARRRAREGCNRKCETDASLLQGVCEMDAYKYVEALASFTKVLAYYTKTEQSQGMCDATLYAALAYSKIGNYAQTIDLLDGLLEFVQQHDMKFYVGQTYRYLGEHYLIKHEPSKALTLLLKAINIFEQIGHQEFAMLSKHFAAVASGEVAMPNIIELILESGVPDERGHQNLLTLIIWKNLRKAPWIEEIPEESASTISTESSSDLEIVTVEEITHSHYSSSGSTIQLSLVEQMEISEILPVAYMDIGDIEIHDLLDII